MAQRLTPIRPQANPVRHFEQPAQPVQEIGENSATQLGRALQGFGNSFLGAMEHKTQRVDKEDVAKGRADRMATHKNYAQAVRDGIITADKSPIYRKAWSEQDGRVAADQYQASLLIAMSVGDLASSMDSNETDGILTKVRTNWMEKNGVNVNDLDFMDGFAPQAQAYEGTIVKEQAHRVTQRFLKKQNLNSYHEYRGVFADARARGLSISAEADGLQLVADRLLGIGTDPESINGILLDAAVAEALETNSLHARDVLEKVKTGSGFLGNTKEAIVAFDQIETRIANTLAAKDVQARQAAQHAREQVVLEAGATAMGLVNDARTNGRTLTLADPDVQPLIAALNKANPAESERIQRILQTANDPRPRTSDQPTLDQMLIDEWEGRITPNQVTTAFEQKLLNPEDASRFHAHIASDARDTESRKKAAEALAHSLQRERIMDSRHAVSESRIEEDKGIQTRRQVYVQGASSIATQFGEDSMGIKILEQGKALNLLKAKSWYYRAAQSESEIHPNMNMQEQSLHALALVKQALQLFPTDIASPTYKDPKRSAVLDRIYTTSAEWQEVFLEYRKSPQGSRLGLVIERLGLRDAGEIQAFLNAQTELFDNQ